MMKKSIMKKKSKRKYVLSNFTFNLKIENDKCSLKGHILNRTGHNLGLWEATNLPHTHKNFPELSNVS